MSKSLTLARLSEYDDILTDHLIDKVHFWTKTHKADRYKTHSSRSVKPQEIVNILKQHIIKRKSKVVDAISAFLSLSTVENFFKRLNDAQKKDFVKHARKYLCIYLPQAGFEICSTDRYPGPKSESCVIANKSLKSGEVLKFLAGTIVAMTEEEENFYETDHDFSILFSSRLNSMCLFLGPARFVNHDCDPNGAFVTQGASIAITTIRPVRVGEEITVFYSPDYFGPNNVDCLCASCEHAGIGGYRRTKVEEFNAMTTDLNQPLASSGFSTSNDTDHQPRKFKYVQTIEVDSELKSGNRAIRSTSQLNTPPDSELSLDEIRKTLDWTNEHDEQYTDQIYAESFPSDEEEDKEYEDQIVVKLEQCEDNDERLAAALNGSDNFRSLNGKSLIPPSGRTQEVVVDVNSTPVKVLRPRRAVHDYNLKRQSLLSINPALELRALQLQRSKRDRRVDVDYCTVCDEELPFEAIVEEIWSVTEAVGIQKILCKRCERHAALYTNPWPDRTTTCLSLRDQDPEVCSVKSSREDTPTQIPFPPDRPAKSASPRKSKLFLPGSTLRQCNTESALDHRQTVPVIELAKARMKSGGIYLPRLARLYKPILLDRSCDRTNSDISTHSRQLEARHSVKGWTTIVDSNIKTQPACIHCRRLKQKCSRVESGADRCDRCCRLDKSCIILDESDRRRYDICGLGASDQAETSTLRKRTLSPDSFVAALQVKSPKKIRRNVETCLSLQLDDPTCTEESKAAAITQKTINQQKFESQDGTTQSTSQYDSGGGHQSNLSLKTETVTTAMPGMADRRRSTKGSWYYVDVDSSDSDDNQPPILPCRTRRQERARSSGPLPTERECYIDIESSDDSSAEVVAYRAPERCLSSTKRKRRTPMWDYVSIDSEEENEKDYIIDVPRSARRRSTIHYKE